MALLPLLAGALVSAALPATSLWIVDDDGGAGVDFTTIQAAVDAATDGDVILVRAGSYARFEIDAKGVAVVGESGALVTVNGGLFAAEAAIIVRNTPAGAAVLLQELTVKGPTPQLFTSAAPALVVSACAGSVALEELFLLPSPDGSSGGAFVETSDQVRISRTTLTGGLPYFATFLETPSLSGLAASGSNVALFDCALQGGAGSSVCGIFGSCGPSQPGGTGLSLAASFVFASGCTIAGGNGGAGESCFPAGAGGEAPDGGDGAVLDAASQLVRLESTVTGGAAGTADCGAPAAAGTALVPGGGVVTLLPGSARSLSATTPATAGSVVGFQFSGEPFDLVLAGVSCAPAHAYLAPFSGLLLVDPAAFHVLVLGTADAAGELFVPHASMPLPGGDEASIRFVQGAWITSAGMPFLGPAVSLVLHQ